MTSTVRLAVLLELGTLTS